MGVGLEELSIDLIEDVMDGFCFIGEFDVKCVFKLGVEVGDDFGVEGWEVGEG